MRKFSKISPSKLLVATNNQGKFIEIKALLDQINIEAIPSFQFGIPEPEETGVSFQENSLLKAQYYSKKTGIFSLADDSGLCIPDLNNDPGVYSARWAIDCKTGQKNFPAAFAKISSELQKSNIDPYSKPKAYFICNLSLFDPKTNLSLSFEGRVDGSLTFPPRGNFGFGYDPIFTKDGMNQTFAEINPRLKDQISHRAKAFKKLVDNLVKLPSATI